MCWGLPYPSVGRIVDKITDEGGACLSIEDGFKWSR